MNRFSLLFRFRRESGDKSYGQGAMSSIVAECAGCVHPHLSIVTRPQGVGCPATGEKPYEDYP